MGLFSRKKSQEGDKLQPAFHNKAHKRSNTSNSSLVGSEFSINHSESSHTSAESFNYHHNKPPTKINKVPLALRPKSAIISSNDQEYNRPNTASKEIKVGMNSNRSPLTEIGSEKAKDVYPNGQNDHSHVEISNSPSPTPPNEVKSHDLVENVEFKSIPSHLFAQNLDNDHAHSFSQTIQPTNNAHQMVELDNQVQEIYPTQLNVELNEARENPLHLNVESNEARASPLQLNVESNEASSGSDEDDDSYDSSTSESSDSEQRPIDHPYYEQWRKYYEAMALQYNRQSMMNPMMYYQYNPQMMAQMNPQMNPQMNSQMNPQMNSQMNPQMNSQMNPQMNPNALHLQMMQMQQMQQMNQFMYNPYMMQQQIQQSQLSIDTPDSSQSQIGPPSRKSSPQEEPTHDYLKAYTKSRKFSKQPDNEENQLISNSRKSTIKLNRYPSAPQSQHTHHTNLSNRINSLDLNFKPGTYEESDDEDEEDIDADSTLQPLSSLSIHNSQSSRQISDYNAFLFDDEDSDDNEENENEEDDTVIANEITTKPDTGLGRKDTSSSEASGNSIQSGGSTKFMVANKSKAQEKPAAPLSKKNRRKDKNEVVKPQLPEYNNIAMNMAPPYMQSMPPPPPPPQMSPYGMMDPMMMNFNPMLMQNTSYGQVDPCSSSKRQSIATTDMKRRSMMPESPCMNSKQYNSNPNLKRYSMPAYPERQPLSPPAPTQPTPTKINDSTINNKIEEFKKLRSVIASGNKSIEYRLHWVKMLISATNFKLYSYINIKGEFVPSNQSAQIKSQFIKSSMTHISKLIKEFESGKKGSQGLISETYFTFALLLKHDYLSQYGQDFNIPKDINKSIEYLNKVLDIEPKNYKALFKMGEIYEIELKNFDKAMDLYKFSAKLGYNKAIFKISMIYLYNADVRSIKYLKYLKNLSSIELSKVRLDDEDYNEMKQVVAEACHEIGKIYEGIYPGDLQAEDSFIKQSLEKAPVNYAKSLTYYNKSAKLNCLESQVRLGLIYEHGELNRTQNANKSIQWFIKASSSLIKRHPDAMCGLARWCLKGSNDENKHIPQPMPDKAVMWCERAIKEYNSKDAMVMMGELIEMGVAQGNPNQWYKRAYALGSEKAGQKLTAK